MYGKTKWEPVTTVTTKFSECVAVMSSGTGMNFAKSPQGPAITRPRSTLLNNNTVSNLFPVTERREFSRLTLIKPCFKKNISLNRPSGFGAGTEIQIQYLLDLATAPPRPTLGFAKNVGGGGGVIMSCESTMDSFEWQQRRTITHGSVSLNNNTK